jgi:iron complex transport system substrate-binding protein
LRRIAALALLCALAAAPAAGADGRGAPRRVVSLNPCLDAILLDVADPSQIAALSRYSREPGQSAVWARARRYPAVSGAAEEIVALRPDLVLISGMGASALTGVLPRLGITAANFGVPGSVAQSEAQVRRVARLVGHPDRGEALVARIEAALAAAAPPPGTPRLSALVYVDQGFASGPGTLMDELMRRAGFDNAVRRYGFTRSADVPLEMVVADPPQVLLAGRLAPGEPTWADRVISHPALRAVAGRMKREAFPQTLLFCAGPVMIPAIEALAAARRDALGEGAS